MAFRKSNLFWEIKISPWHNILCSSLVHVSTMDERHTRVLLPCVALVHHKNPVQTPLFQSRFFLPQLSPMDDISSLLIPFPSLHTLMLLTKPQWTRRLTWFHM
jgi:hypothetical protein